MFSTETDYLGISGLWEWLRDAQSVSPRPPVPTPQSQRPSTLWLSVCPQVLLEHSRQIWRGTCTFKHLWTERNDNWIIKILGGFFGTVYLYDQNIFNRKYSFVLIDLILKQLWKMKVYSGQQHYKFDST